VRPGDRGEAYVTIDDAAWHLVSVLDAWLDQINREDLLLHPRTAPTAAAV
jgi:hypothetical protein